MPDDYLDQSEIRREKLRRLQTKGEDPFAHHKYARTHLAVEVENQFEQFEGQQVSVCGRLMAYRGHGKSAFADLHDPSGRIQLFAKLDVLGEGRFEAFEDLDLGDILGVTGTVFRTRSGEVTVQVQDFTLLAKALRPLPEKWHGLQDQELRYRQRYLDLIMNREVREVFRSRSRMIAAAREMLTERGFLEVETPVLQPIYGGAAARPFTTHHNALDTQLYMRIAPELYLKRLIVGGLERVFEIGRMFRNEGIDTRHNPEFTMLEAYQAYADVEDMMALTEALVCTMVQAVHGKLQCSYQGNEIDFTPPWRRAPLLQLVNKATGIELDQLQDDEHARKAVASAGLELGDLTGMSLYHILDKTFDRYVQPELIQPTLVTDYPVEMSPLAKRKPGEPHLTARFEPFIGGEELGNAFSELNDPLDQRARLEAQAEARLAGDEEAHPLDEDFLQALEYGMPPTGGMGLGIDRLVMIVTDNPNLREVVLFPLLRPREGD